LNYNDTLSGSILSVYNPSDPVTGPDVTIPYGTNTTLNAVSVDNVYWFDDPVEVVPVGNGSSYTTPFLYDTSTYFAQAFRESGSGLLAITELHMDDYTDYIEIQNTTGYTQDFTGWIVAISDYKNEINEVNSIYWNLGVMQPWEIQYRSDANDSTNWGQNIRWDGQDGWAIILDDQGNVVDFIVFGFPADSIANFHPIINGHQVTLGNQWNGNAFLKCNLDLIQRVSCIDHNDSSDYTCGGFATPGFQNQWYDPRNCIGSEYYGCGSNRLPVTVYVSGIPGVDVGITNVLSPPFVTLPGQNYQVTAEIYNYGIDTITSIPLVYSTNGTSAVSESWTGTLLPKGTTTYNFSAQFQAPADSVCQICIYTILGTDSFPINDTSCKNFFSSPAGIGDYESDGLWLGQNIPNPAAYQTYIDYYIPENGMAQFVVYNLIGEVLYHCEKNMPKGKQRIILDISKFPSGLYYYTLQFNGRRLVKKMIVNSR